MKFATGLCRIVRCPVTLRRSMAGALAGALALGLALNASVGAAAEDIVPPNANLKADGIPTITKALADRVAAYTDFRGHGFVDWHPKRREMLVVHRAKDANTPQLFLLRSPGAALEPITRFPEPVVEGKFDPIDGRFIVFAKDAGGNEAARIYRLDLGDTGLPAPGAEPVLLSSPDERSDFTFNTRGDRVLIASVPLDRTAQGGKREQVMTHLTLIDPRAPGTGRRVADLPGGGWFAFRFSPDDQTLVALQYRSATDASVWRMNVATGEREQLLPRPGESRKAMYLGFDFSADGKTLYLVTNEAGEFTQFARFDLETRTLTMLSSHIPWDTERFGLSEDGKRLFAVFNQDGTDVLRWFDPVSGREISGPAPTGLGAINGGAWHRTRVSELAFARRTPTSPGDVYSIDAATGETVRWTTAAAAIDTAAFVEPEIVRWKSFDGREISGILHLPPARFGGRRPVLVAIHGGPEGQATVGFLGRWNYFLNEMGVAILEPNVRGSSGYGKTFLELDNGMKREDSVKDIGALLDWLPAHPRLDAQRVMVEGGSYGGYMSLAVLTHYSDRLRGGVDEVGISHFVTFLNNTESYRRDLRRVEYGDERQPEMKQFMETIAPLNNAHRIKVPLMVVHGKNDPRVPYTEAEQIVARVRQNGVPVWYLLADNEGHGFARKNNADYKFYALIRFMETYLLP